MDIYNNPNLKFRRRILTIVGAKIDVSDAATDAKIGFVKLKALRLREDIKLYTDDTKTTELMRIKARNVIDFGATYDVFNPDSVETPLFSFRRKGLRSLFVRDKWLVLAQGDVPYAQLEEVGKIAIFRRYISIVPYLGDVVDLVLFWRKQRYTLHLLDGDTKGAYLGQLTRLKNPFVSKYTSDNEGAEAAAPQGVFLGLGILLAAIERSKN